MTAIGLVALGRLLDFGVRRWHEQIWLFARVTLWDSVAGLKPTQLHAKLVRWLDRYLNHQPDSQEENRFFVALLVFMVLSLCLCWLSTSMFIRLELGDFGAHEADLYPLIVLRDVSGSMVAIIVSVSLFFALFYWNEFWAVPFDRAVARGKASDRSAVRRFASISLQAMIGAIWGVLWGIIVVVAITLIFAMITSPFRAPTWSLLINLILDLMTFGVTAGFLKLAARGGTLRHCLCMLGDLAAAIVIAFFSFYFMNLVYGMSGYRWPSQGPMNATLVLLMTTALIPTLCIVILLFSLVTLRVSQIALRLLGMYTIDQVANPKCDDEALPFTTLGFLAAVPVLLFYALGWVAKLAPGIAVG